jgi:hypothetical protein
MKKIKLQEEKPKMKVIELTDEQAMLIQEAIRDKLEEFEGYVENNTIRKWKKLADDFYDKIKGAR